MKIRLFSVVALAMAGLLSSSCAVEESESPKGSIRAVMEGEQTKTSVTDVGSFTWSAGDEVWLHTTSGSVVGTLSSGEGTAFASFAYDTFIGELTGRAIYPYNSGHSMSGDELVFVFPASYDLGSNYTNTNAAMYGVKAGNAIRFTHLGGVMRFKFKNVPAGTDKFQITLDKKINGTFTADLTADLPMVETVASDDVSGKTVTLNFDPLTSVSDICLYIPLPVGTYNSLNLDIWAGNESVWTYSNDVTNTVNRKTLLLMPTVTIGGEIGGETDNDEPEMGDSGEGCEPQEGDYVDEYGINHGPGIQIGEIVWAPVNCGYKAPTAESKGYPYGKLYQWGRKYGQGYSEDYDESVPQIVTGPIRSIDVAQSIEKEDVFYTSSNEAYNDWLYEGESGIWNAGSESSPEKSQYDPCPDNWRLPTESEMNSLSSVSLVWKDEYDGMSGFLFEGIDEQSALFLPAAGYRSVSGSQYSRGKYGRYWSSFPSNSFYSTYFHMSNSTFTAYSNQYRAIGCSVRCIQVID